MSDTLTTGIWLLRDALMAFVNDLPKEYDDPHTKNLLEIAQRAIDATEILSHKCPTCDGYKDEFDDEEWYCQFCEQHVPERNKLPTQ